MEDLQVEDFNDPIEHKAEQTADGFVKKAAFRDENFGCGRLCSGSGGHRSFSAYRPADAADYQSGTGDAGGSDRHATDGAGDADGYSNAV